MDITSFKVGKPVLTPKDKIGRRWAMANSIVVGDKLQCDAGFTCLPANAIRRVKFDASKPSEGGIGGYYVTCNDKAAHCRHYLSGQLGYTPETKGALVGFYPVK